MRLLILGGTRFVGRHLAAEALARGWHVTLFNRGQSGPELFPEAEHLSGDRDGGLDALRSGDWDAVVDTSGYVPRLVRGSAELLAGRVGIYVFISSASAYADKSQAGLTEDAPLVELEEPRSEDVGQHYDGLKALCERAVTEASSASAIVRPGLIVGPHDPTNRFSWWVAKIASGGRITAPEPRDQPVQVIDARDLAAFTLRIAERRDGDVYNAVGDVSTMRRTLEVIVDATGAEAELDWVPEQQLLDQGLEPWTDLPLWLAPGSQPAYRGFLAMSNERAKRAGLTLRPLAQTVGDILAG